MPSGAGVGVLANIDAGVLGRSMLDAAKAARIGVTVTFVDGAHPQNVYVNEAAGDIMGWSTEELLERDPMGLIAGTDQSRVQDRLARRQGGEGGPTSYELTVVRKDGRQVPIEVTATRATIDGRAAVFAFIVDASARKEAEQLRRRHEERFRDLIEAAPELIGIIRDGRFVYANRAYVRALGFESAEQLGGVTIASLVEPDDADAQRRREELLRAGGEPPPPHTYRVLRRDGTRLLLEATSVYFEYEGKPSVLAMARDVTQRKQLERQLIQADRLAALGTMAAGVAHEINNPLAYVMLNLEWIARKLPNVQSDPESLPALLVMLDEARQGAQRVSTIVRELRSFSRAEGEKRRPVDLASVVQAVIKMVGNEVRHRARVTTSFETTRPVLANESRLEQVVVNLLLNAAQSMPEGRAEKNEIAVHVREDGEHRAILEIVDNGTGIPADVLPRIFDPFFTTKPVGVGTGLGLSICHGIVTSLGGQIAAYGDATGTTFRVVLPTSETLAADSTPPANEQPSSRDSIRARILVVDDEPQIANALRELLAPEHTVVAAASAREALEAIEGEDFDVVFCDLMMPGADGVDLFERVRARRPGFERRIVFMTGGAFTTRAAEFLASVDNRRLEKPFSLGLVERIVRDMALSAREASAAR